MGAGRRRARVLSPIFAGLTALPAIVLYPVVAWTGIGPVSKIIYATAAGFFRLRLQRYPASAPSISVMLSSPARWARPVFGSSARSCSAWRFRR